jgi:hypothetical protein
MPKNEFGPAGSVLRARANEILERYAKKNNLEPEDAHPLNILLTIAHDKVNVSTAIRVDAARRALAVLLPTLQSETVEVSHDPQAQPTRVQLVQAIISADKSEREALKEFLRIEAPRPDEVLDAEFSEVSE